MAVTSHPPHRPVLAGTTAYGSYLGSTRCVVTSGDMERRLRTPHCPWDTLISLICVRHVLSIMMFSLVTGLPSTTSAAGISTDLVRWLRWYYADVRLLAGVHARVALLAFRGDPVAVWPRMPARSLGSRACSFSTCVRLLDYAGPASDSRYRPLQCCIPVRSTRSAPQIAFFEARFLARRCLCLHFTRHLAQDSRSRWFATPFLWGSFIPDYTPVYPDACAP